MSYGIVAMPLLLKDVCHDPSGPLAKLNRKCFMLGQVVGGKCGMREAMREAHLWVREALRCARHMECGKPRLSSQLRT